MGSNHKTLIPRLKLYSQQNRDIDAFMVFDVELFIWKLFQLANAMKSTESTSRDE